MKQLVVVERPERWALALPDVEIVHARDYLAAETYGRLSSVRVLNLCRHYGYQRLGYYVSLLAEARGHRPMPSVVTLQDLKLAPLLRLASAELEDLVQRGLKPLRGERFSLSVYFGRNMVQRYDRLAQALFNLFPAALLRAEFSRRDEADWQLDGVKLISAAEIPEEHWDFALERAREYFAGRASARRRKRRRWDLAILVPSDEDVEGPSNRRAIENFVRSARRHELEPEVIDRADFPSLGEYDALFIRETTAVNHHTYRFARRAAAEGLVVIDDPTSIVRCTNKIYLDEVFNRQRVRTPKTVVVDRARTRGETAESIIEAVGLPCVVKQPDSAFSKGVRRAESAEELEALLETFFKESELLLVQGFLPSDFDWRIGVLDGEPFFACRYHMAQGHWQIISGKGDKSSDYGRVEALPLSEVPQEVLSMARRSTRAIGDSLYGVDIKEVDGGFYAIEVNDNPSIDTGYEDGVIGKALYDTVMASFRRRLEARG